MVFFETQCIDRLRGRLFRMACVIGVHVCVCVCVQLIRRYWHQSRRGGRRRGRDRGGNLLTVDMTVSDEPDSFLEKHGMTRDRRPTSDLIDAVPQTHLHR